MIRPRTPTRSRPGTSVKGRTRSPGATRRDTRLPSVDPPSADPPRLSRVEDHFVGRFTAMGSPCEVLVDTEDRAGAEARVAVARAEALRIEVKFSRYRTGNIVHRINHAGGEPVPVDEETARLIDYAAVCHQMSDGRFDITSGVLRRAWTFDGSDRVPDQAAVRALLTHVGWHRVSWTGAVISLPAGMEIDLGGLGKEYAVDRAAGLLSSDPPGIPAPGTGAITPFVVNFGGDLFVSGWRRGERPWLIGVDDPDQTGETASLRLELSEGGLATSGDARRFVRWNGKRLGHILDPRTGWPVVDAPRAITVLGRTCLEAGTLSTLAYLQGPRARTFLRDQGVHFWII
jgi:FAD:protein FMN transferase